MVCCMFVKLFYSHRSHILVFLRWTCPSVLEINSSHNNFLVTELLIFQGTRIKLNSHKTLFGVRVKQLTNILGFFIEHESHTSVLGVKFQKDRAAGIYLPGERDFARFKLRISEGTPLL